MRSFAEPDLHKGTTLGSRVNIKKWFQRKKAVLKGDVCTIRLKSLGYGDLKSEQIQGHLQEISIAIEAYLTKSLLESLGPDFKINKIHFLGGHTEVLILIGTQHYEITSYKKFVESLKMLVVNFRSAYRWALAEKTQLPQSIVGYWSPEPPLIHLRLDVPLTGDPFLKRMQQPLSLLILGTVLGSVIVPYLNDLSNRKKVRHEERVKMALSIVEQSHETDRRLYNLMEYLVLFRKDHKDSSASGVSLKKEQYSARKAFDEMYLSFNAQAWWWHWNVKSESRLSAIATQQEAETISRLAREYSDALQQSTAAISKAWDRFLKQPFDPADPQNDALIKDVQQELTATRNRRNDIALEMAQVFASE